MFAWIIIVGGRLSKSRLPDIRWLFKLACKVVTCSDHHYLLLFGKKGREKEMEEVWMLRDNVARAFRKSGNQQQQVALVIWNDFWAFFVCNDLIGKVSNNNNSYSICGSNKTSRNQKEKSLKAKKAKGESWGRFVIIAQGQPWAILALSFSIFKQLVADYFKTNSLRFSFTKIKLTLEDVLFATRDFRTR